MRLRNIVNIVGKLGRRPETYQFGFWESMSPVYVVRLVGMDGRHLEWHKEMAHNDDLDGRPSYKDVEVHEGRDKVFGVLEDTVEAVGGHEDTVEVALLLPVTHSPVPSLQPKDPQPDLAQQVYGGPVQSLHPMPDQT